MLSPEGSGPLGSWGILFTPAAMVIAQTILVLPIITALARQVVADAMRDGGDQLRSMGAGSSTRARRSRSTAMRCAGSRAGAASANGTTVAAMPVRACV